MIPTALTAALLFLIGGGGAAGGAAGKAGSPASDGYRLLLEKPYLPADFDQQVFDELWHVWEEPARTAAARATPAERRRMAFDRYGFTEAPGRPGPLPLQYTPDGRGGWVMNCFACHGGKVAGTIIPGAPNTLFAMQTLIDDVRLTKIRLAKPLAHLDLGSVFIPLGQSNGTTNSVIFGIALGSHRDADLNFRPRLFPPKMLHHDHDAPPWWVVKRKHRLYSDGFAAKGHRPLMQFLMVEQNGPEKFREWEQDFERILAWIESIETPKYPWPIDHPLAAKGELVFNRSCAECHGTYGAHADYPSRIVPIEEVGTDRARLDAIEVSLRTEYGKSWFAHHGRDKVITNPGGYVAPPLDGIWASAPYFHNGSVPTLWHVLHPSQRPELWRRTPDGYDRQRVGLEISTPAKMPPNLSGAEKRKFFDTHIFGKSPAGHRFPDALTEEEKSAVLEYLKTL